MPSKISWIGCALCNDQLLTFPLSSPNEFHEWLWLDKALKKQRRKIFFLQSTTAIKEKLFFSWCIKHSNSLPKRDKKSWETANHFIITAKNLQASIFWLVMLQYWLILCKCLGSQNNAHWQERIRIWWTWKCSTMRRKFTKTVKRDDIFLPSTYM